MSEVGLRPVAVNLLGLVEHPSFGSTPYQVDEDGKPYVPTGDGGIVLDLRLGDSVFGTDADHAAPGACLIHPEQPARHALASYACLGNPVVVRTGRAAGARGAVLGQRGEEGRVIACFTQDDLARLRPSDQVSVRACGQGWRPPGFPAGVAIMNLAPGALDALPVEASSGGVTAGVRTVVPSKQAGNGIGRPSASWDLDLSLRPADGDVRLGDLIAVSGLDARYNMGYRRDWVTVGIVVHTASPLPGHGPGITPILSGPAELVQTRPDPDNHAGLTDSALHLLAATGQELKLRTTLVR